MEKTFSMKSRMMVLLSAIFVILVFSTGYFVFLNTGIKGEWKLSDLDMHCLLNFQDEGKVTWTIDSFSVDGKYEILQKDKLKLDIVPKFWPEFIANLFADPTLVPSMSTECGYHVNSGLLKKNLELYYSRGGSQRFEEYNEEQSSFGKTFLQDAELLGTWQSENGTTLQFLIGGQASLHLENSTVKFSYTPTESGAALVCIFAEQTIELSAQYDGEALTFSGQEFTKKA